MTNAKRNEPVTLSQIAASLRMDTRRARAKLRRAKHVPKTVRHDRWEWPMKDVNAVKQVLIEDSNK